MPRNTARTVSFVHPAVGETKAIRGTKLGGAYTAGSIDRALNKNRERSVENARLFATQEEYSTTDRADSTIATDRTAITQLSQVRQQRKLETENALLREALATSAQNCEKLMKQFIESQNHFNNEISKQLMWIQNQSEETKVTIYTDMETIKKMLQQSEKNHQTHQIKLQNMNEEFSKSLNDALTHTSDKLITQVKADTDTVLKSNIQAMEDTVKHMKQAATNVTAFESKLKTSLDKRIKAYNSSIQRLFKLDGWRHMVFWASIVGGILTPIVLIVGYFL